MEDSGGMLFPLVMLVLFIVVMAGFWKTFTKAGKPGWATLIPIYNLVVMLQIAGRPIWWLILMFIPIVNFFVTLVVSIDIAKNFGKGMGFGLGLAFLGPIFFPILGFGSAEYMPEN
jgi:hypothetical protein